MNKVIFVLFKIKKNILLLLLLLLLCYQPSDDQKLRETFFSLKFGSQGTEEENNSCKIKDHFRTIPLVNSSISNHLGQVTLALIFKLLRPSTSIVYSHKN